MRWATAVVDGRTLRLRAQQQAMRQAREARIEERTTRWATADRRGSQSRIGQAGAASSRREDSPTSTGSAFAIPTVEEIAADLGLTPREAQIARFLVWGDSNKAIASKLDIQPGTVRKHVEHVLRKIDATSRRMVTRLVLHLEEPA